MDISQLHSLPIDEKIELIGALWDDIDDSNAPITLSPGVVAEIKRRREELEQNPEIAIDRDEMWRRVNEARRTDA